MYVCANCAQHAAEHLRMRAAHAIQKAENERLRQELADTEAAFWQLACDVRLNPVLLEVSDNYVSAIFPADDSGERTVS